MLHELRFYEIAAGRLDDYINHAGKIAVPFRGDDYGKLLGFWSCEIGAVNCVFNLWEHESVATREVLRAKLQTQDVWRNEYLPHSQPLMRRQVSRLLTPLADPHPPAAPGNVYCLQILKVVTAGVVLYGCVMDAHAHAQAYPVRPIRLVVSVQPGGNLDLIGRSVADKVSEGLGQRMFVENRPGANSTIGLASVARATPDGYTLVMVAQSAVVAAKMMRNPPYDPVRDFSGVSHIATLPQMLVVHPSLPVKSVKEFIAFAKARPGEINCSSSGNGSGSHLALELFKRLAGVQIMRIPYNGDGPAIIDLLGGQVPVKFDNLSTSLQHVRGARLRALGITSPVRSALLPDVPAISETVPGFQASIFNGMMAPAATPPEILNRLHAEIVKFVQAPEIRSRFASQGVELQASTAPAEFTAFIKSETARWGRVLDEAGIKAE